MVLEEQVEGEKNADSSRQVVGEKISENRVKRGEPDPQCQHQKEAQDVRGDSPLSGTQREDGEAVNTKC